MNPTPIRLSRLRSLLHALRSGHLPEYHEVYVHHVDTRVVCSRCPATAMSPRPV